MLLTHHAALAVPEMVDRIVDYLQADKASLHYTSQVARLWVGRSQHHLLKKIRITGVDEMRTLLSHIKQRPQLGGCIVSLRISSLVMGNSPIALATLLDLVAFLSRLQDLVFSGIFGMRPLDGHVPLKHARDFLRSLTFDHCEFKDTVYLIALLQAFPAIGTMCFEKSTIDRYYSINMGLPSLFRAVVVDYLVLKVLNPGAERYRYCCPPELLCQFISGKSP